MSVGDKVRREEALDFSGCNSRPGTEALESVSESIDQANLESMASVCHLAGGHRSRIHKPRLCRTYRADSVSDPPFSLWRASGGVRGLARVASKDRAHCWLLHTESSSVSLLACHVSPP